MIFSRGKEGGLQKARGRAVDSEDLKGFTVFRDTLGVYNFTKVLICSVFLWTCSLIS